MTEKQIWRVSVVLFCVCINVLSSCATVFNRRYRVDLPVKTEPTGAKIVVDDGKQTCKSPCSVKLEADTHHSVKAKFEGRKSKTESVRRGIAWQFWLNFIVGPYAFVPMGVDWASGKMWRIPKKELLIKLDEEGDDEESEDAGETSREGAASAKQPESKGAAKTSQTPMQVNPLSAPAETKTPPKPEPKPRQLNRAEKERLETQFPPSQIELMGVDYYGEQTSAKRAAMVRRIYQHLQTMAEEGQRPDLDEAFRRDQIVQDGK